MTPAAVLEIVAFGLCALIALAGALGMATTMSMFRSGIFLMASFFGVAGLFILLSADLLGLLQIMMYVGGMLVMILFMVLFMHDPGGAMMAGMSGLALPERFFSKGLAQNDPEGKGPHAGNGHEEHQGPGDHGGHEHHQVDMSMVTPVRRWAAWIGASVGALLSALLILAPAWPESDALPNPYAAEEVGTLLMNKYMIAFEGAGTLILIGIFGAVWIARPGRHPDPTGREHPVIHGDDPPKPPEEPLPPLNGAAAPDPAQPPSDDHGGGRP